MRLLRASMMSIMFAMLGWFGNSLCARSAQLLHITIGVPVVVKCPALGSLISMAMLLDGYIPIYFDFI
jgi:hypothetical protein